MKVNRIIGSISMSLLLTAALSGCGFRALPDEERYQYIDNVLETIDYKTVGNIVEEKIDDGDGILSPSYKKVYYGSDGSFKELEKRLKIGSDTCKGNQEIGQITCSYPYVSVRVFYNKNINTGLGFESVIFITDSSSGRGN